MEIYQNLWQYVVFTYIKDKLHGLVQNSQFNTVSTHIDAPSPMDSNENNKDSDQAQA